MDGKLLAPWLVLHLLPGMSARYFNILLDVFETPARVLDSDPGMLRKAGFPRETVQGLQDYQGSRAGSQLGQQLEKILQWGRGDQHSIVTRADAGYPESLLAIADPPPLLYILGEAPLLSELQVAVVGSRKPSAGGRRTARRFAAQLAENQVCITSGLALGIDSQSHQGALDVAGKTLAVLGTGIDQVYPGRNRYLAERIAQSGAMVSEFPLGSQALPWHFPLRNRIISGLSRAVVVIEAARKSGSLITAQTALEQGREVFAVPGSIDNPLARGCHYLIRQGAMLVDRPELILQELAPQLPSADAGAGRHHRTANSMPSSAGANAKKILREIGYDVVGMDQLLQLTGLEISELSAGL
ncbi:MAG: DNA-processing protein DprA, partial [Pseudohongiellaceae bacterium]